MVFFALRALPGTLNFFVKGTKYESETCRDLYVGNDRHQTQKVKVWSVLIFQMAVFIMR